MKETRLLARALAALLWTDVQLFLLGFSALHECVKRARVEPRPTGPDVGTIVRAVDVAAVFYFKPVRCLQRSAAAVLLLRRGGAPAELVIGVQPWPLRAHAWVELDGTVVNDRAHVVRTFAVLERC